MSKTDYVETIHNFIPGSVLVSPKLKDPFKRIKSGWPPLSASDVKRIREGRGISQLQFCAMYGFSLQSLQRWETRKRIPDQMSNLLLRMIEADPQSVYRTINKVREELREEE